MKKSEFKKLIKESKSPPAQRKGEYIDPVKELKRAYAEPQRVAKVGGKGYV